MGKKTSKTKNQNHSYDNDERFAAAENRPQFRLRKDHSTNKVILDERFASVLTDPRFQLQERDKYGRGRKKKSTAKEELSAFYRVVDDDDEQKLSSKSKPTKSGKNKKKNYNTTKKYDEFSSSASSSSLSSSSSSVAEKFASDDKGKDQISRIAYLTALSRGELDVSSSSSSSSSESVNHDGDNEYDDDDDSRSSSDGGAISDKEEDALCGTAGVLDPSTEENIEISYAPSRYMAVMNMDWDHVRALDIFVIISSFTPPSAVKHVCVVPSDFGMERMAREERYGPSGLWKKNINENDGNLDEVRRGEEKEEEDEVHSGNDDVVDSVYNDEDEDLDSKNSGGASGPNIQKVESDFDPEKLRAYEASKLKYYFAVVEFTSVENADIAYREVDGLEFEHSSSAVDLRTIPPEELDSVLKGRSIRDEATSIPSNYVPPDFVVSALQQTNVQCTWETGDHDREKTLSKYSIAGQWESLTETDDLRAYLASENSTSDDDSDDEKGRRKKGSNMRKLLGLNTSDGEENSDRSFSSNHAFSSDDDVGKESCKNKEEEDFSKEVTFVPGKKALQEKIRDKLRSKEEVTQEELTPWEKYQMKRKEKRRERRQARRNLRKNIDGEKKNHAVDSDMEVNDEEDSRNSSEEDEFFMETKKVKTKGRKKRKRVESEADKTIEKNVTSKEELELLLAGDEDEEAAKDYDIRGLQRVEKNKNKKLRGSRKRKEEKLAASLTGLEFKVDLQDERFAAVLDGQDDRFGIDRTDSNFKDTSAMRDIMKEQTRRRKEKRRKKSKKSDGNSPMVGNVSTEMESSEGLASKKQSSDTAALSALVKSLKTKVAAKNQ